MAQNFLVNYQGERRDRGNLGDCSDIESVHTMKSSTISPRSRTVEIMYSNNIPHKCIYNSIYSVRI